MCNWEEIICACGRKVRIERTFCSKVAGHAINWGYFYTCTAHSIWIEEKYAKKCRCRDMSDRWAQFEQAPAHGVNGSSDELIHVLTCGHEIIEALPVELHSDHRYVKAKVVALRYGRKCESFGQSCEGKKLLGNVGYYRSLLLLYGRRFNLSYNHTEIIKKQLLIVYIKNNCCTIDSSSSNTKKV